MSDYYLLNPGGNDGNPGSLAQPWLTLQHALDTAVAGDRVFCQGGETIAATIDDDTNSGLNGNWIQFIGVNSSWVEDGTQYIVDGNSTSARCVAMNARAKKQYRNFFFTRATGAGFETVTAQSSHISFVNSSFRVNGSDGFKAATVPLTYPDFWGCDFSTNTGHGLNGAGGGTQASAFWGCRFSANGGYGLNSPYHQCHVVKSVLADNTSGGLAIGGNALYIDDCVFAGNPIGLYCVSGYSQLFVFSSLFRGNTTGISLASNASLVMYSDYLSWYLNGTKVNRGANASYINGGHDVDELADPCRNYVGKDYRPNSSMGLLNVSRTLPGGVNIDYITAGLHIVPPVLPPTLKVENLFPYGYYSELIGNMPAGGGGSSWGFGTSRKRSLRHAGKR